MNSKLKTYYKIYINEKKNVIWLQVYNSYNYGKTG